MMERRQQAVRLAAEAERRLLPAQGMSGRFWKMKKSKKGLSSRASGRKGIPPDSLISDFELPER